MDYKELSRNLISTEAYWQVNKAIAKITDNDTAILLADLISKEKYFENKGQMNGDYFFNTVENIEQDTNIKKDKQRMCLTKLENLGIVETKMITIPRKRHYKINHEKLFLALSEANKIYSERKIRPLVDDYNDDCTTENTTTINKNKYNENKLNKNKFNIKGSFKKQNELDIRYKSKDDFLKDINLNTDSNIYKISELIYRNFMAQLGCNHYKLNKEQKEKMIDGLKLIDELTEDWEQVRKIINQYFRLERAYYTIQDLTNHNTLAYLFSLTGIAEITERFDSDGKWQGII